MVLLFFFQRLALTLVGCHQVAGTHSLVDVPGPQDGLIGCVAAPEHFASWLEGGFVRSSKREKKTLPEIYFGVHMMHLTLVPKGINCSQSSGPGSQARLRPSLVRVFSGGSPVRAGSTFVPVLHLKVPLLGVVN